MVSRQKGFVLMLVLVFTNLIAILSMVNESLVELQMRMSSNEQVSLQTLLVARAGLKIAYMRLDQKNHPCLSETVLLSSSLLGKSESWWHSDVVCHGQFAGQDFQYIIEPLGVDYCAILDGHRGVQYYRITVRAEAFNSSVILQSTVVLPSSNLQKCEYETRKLLNVWQSIRQLK
jgi:Tfp pilus assembly protein PilX